MDLFFKVVNYFHENISDCFFSICTVVEALLDENENVWDYFSKKGLCFKNLFYPPISRLCIYDIYDKE